MQSMSSANALKHVGNKHISQHISEHAYFAVPAWHRHAAFFRWPRETGSP